MERSRMTDGASVSLSRTKMLAIDASHTPSASQATDCSFSAAKPVMSFASQLPGKSLSKSYHGIATGKSARRKRLMFRSPIWRNRAWARRSTQET